MRRARDLESGCDGARRPGRAAGHRHPACESEAAEHDLHAFQAIRRMDEILIANFMVFHDLAREENYDLWIGDEAWELDYYRHENPEQKHASYAWLTDFVGRLPMPGAGAREEFLTADQFVVLSRTGDGLTVGFQRVPEAKAGKNRLHLDLIVEDLDVSTAEIDGLGGRWLKPGEPRELEGFRWRQMADTDGNEFDIDVLPAG